MSAEILPGKTILEALNTDLVCDAINTAMRELFLQIAYGRTQSAFSEGGLPIGAGLEDLGKGLRSQVGTMYKKLTNTVTGVLTGKGLEYGGSLVRPEATGFGGLYFVQQMLETAGDSLKGKTVAISGFGNVAWGAALKASQLGAKVVTISGPDGYIYDPNGVSGDKIDYLLELRASCNDVVAPYAEQFGATFVPNKRP